MTTKIDAHDGDSTSAVVVRPNGESFITRLTTGTGAFDIIGRRRWFYLFSTVLVLGSILFILLRGFNLGTDFKGGTTLTFKPAGAASSVSQAQVGSVVKQATSIEPESVQTLGNTGVQVSMPALSPDQVAAAKAALTNAFQPIGGVSDSAVSETWGSQISQRAIIAVIVFLVAVAAFIWIRYEKRVAVGAVVSTVHDVLVTAGIYAAVGFEVTPATVIGLLTILGFSLYDTVVVYDKVQENTKGLTSLFRRTYPEAANLAVNQTLMRSINTSLIAMLPVAGLLVAGVAILGSGTLKDLALVLLVGMLVGAYSSVFVAVPIAVDLKIREGSIRTHTARVLAKRKADRLIVDADGDPIGRKALDGSDLAVRPTSTGRQASLPAIGLKAGVAPKPGVKPARPAPAPRVAPAKPVPTTVRSGAKRVGRAGTGSSPLGSSPLGSSPLGSVEPAVARPSDVDDAAPKEPAVGRPAPVPAKRTAITGKAARPTGKSARPTGKRGR